MSKISQGLPMAFCSVRRSWWSRAMLGYTYIDDPRSHWIETCFGEAWSRGEALADQNKFANLS